MTELAVISNRRVSEGTFCLRLTRPASEVRAGQCFSLGLKHLGINREYSIYSGADDDFLEFLIREIPDGIVSTALARCKKGELIEVGGPYGDFCLNKDFVSSQNYGFIASGTGIAPFHSFVRTFPELKYQMFHGIRFENEMYDANDYHPDRYFAAVSRPSTERKSERVTDILRTMSISEIDVFYLCGNRQMITDTIQILRDRGVSGGEIYTETFF